MELQDYLDTAKDAANTAAFPLTALGKGINALAPGGDWGGMADIAGNVGMGALEIGNAPFQVAGEAIRGASENEPLKMATQADPSGFRWPSIVQRLAPSTRTEEPPADPFMKAYQGLEGLTTLPTQGVKGASDIVTGQPDIGAQLGGLGMSFGVMPLHPEKMTAPELPEYLKNERGGLTLGPESKPSAGELPGPSPWFSRLENTLQAKLPEKADVGQIKNIISTLPKEEVDWRGLNDFLEQKHGVIPKADVMEQLKQNPVELGETKLAGKPSDYRSPQARQPRTLEDESDLDFEDYPNDVQQKAEELQNEAADRAMEDFYWEPGDGYGVEPIDMTEANIQRGPGQKDLWGKEIEPLPEEQMVMYDGKPVQHGDLSNYYQKKSYPDEEGNAIFKDRDDAYEAYYEYIQDDESNARDEAYLDWKRDNPVENYLEDAKAEVGYVHEPEGMEYANADEARSAFNQGTHDIYDESDDLVQSLADITNNQDYRMLPVEGDPIPRLAPGQAPPGMPPPPGAGPTKFESYSTPGGENYREVLMTLPRKDQPISNEEILAKAKSMAQESNENWDRLGPNGRQRYEDQANNEIASQRRETFQSGHWDQPNVLAHIRLKDFADPATGKKTLLVDEIQSDWHQQGRAKGYKNPEIDKKIAVNEGIIDEAQQEAANIRFKYRDVQRAQFQDDPEGFSAYVYQHEPRYTELMNQWVNAKNENEALAKQTGRLPNAPFKKNWQELAFKRALQEAVAGGYDEMAWTTGEQQADRYNLAKQISSLSYQPNSDGTFKLSADAQGRGIMLGENLTPDKMGEMVGKDIADRIVAGAGDPQNFASNNMPPDNWKSLSGVDLKVGGEGMKGFYDEILPSYANKYLKKYGVKVEDTSLVTHGNKVARQNADGSVGPPSERVHSVKITPEMKADILGKGQPMWQIPAMIGAGAATAAGGQEQKQYAQGGVVQEEAMPFQSQAQRGFMYAKHPKIAKRFEAETPKDAKLPEHVKKMHGGGMVGDWKDDLAGYMDEHFAKKPMQHLFDGGTAGDFDVDYGDTNTARGASYTPPAPETPMPNPSPSPVQAPAFNPKAGLPPAPPPAAPAAMPSAAPTGPDPLQAYLTQQRSDLNKYGPEEQLALEQALQKQRTGFLPNLANAGAGLADAIMQGVARAGPSNFQANLENRMDKTQEAQRQALQRAQTGHLARMKQEMELAQIDPSSPISRVAQRSAMPILKRLGLSDSEIGNIPASLVAEAKTNQLSLEEIRAKMAETQALREQTHEYQMGELGLRGETLRANVAHQQAEQQAKQAELRERAATGLQGRPWYQKAFEAVTPGFMNSAATREQMAQIQANPDNHEAMDWIQQHPNDPRIPAIIKKLAR